MKIVRFYFEFLLLAGALLLLGACQSNQYRTGETSSGVITKASDATDKVSSSSTNDRQGDRLLQLKINNQDISVDWEDNATVTALKERLASQALTVTLTRHGGFEQVGSLGMTLPSQDSNQTAQPGDIMLYNSSQIVFFYGSNNWSYTKLGHISEPIDITSLLDKEQVSITLSLTE